MSTTRHDIPVRWIDTDAQRARRRTRPLIALALLCPAVFGGFFAVGRATVSTPSPHPNSPAPSFPITYAGAPIPARLGNAAPLDAIASADVARRNSPHRSSSPGARTPVATPVTQPAASSAPTAVGAPPAATTTPTPTATAPASHSQPRKSGGVSFDSSG